MARKVYISGDTGSSFDDGINYSVVDENGRTVVSVSGRAPKFRERLQDLRGIIDREIIFGTTSEGTRAPLSQMALEGLNI